MTNVTENRQSKFASISKHAAMTIGLFAVFAYIAISVLNYRFPSANIQGVSMLPNFQANKTYVTERVFVDPERLDVVVMRPADFDDSSKAIIAETLGDVELYVKRVIGLPGDVVTFNKDSGRVLHINNIPVQYARNKDIPTFALTEKSDPAVAVMVVGMTTTYQGDNVNVYEADFDFTHVDTQTRAFFSKIKPPYLLDGQHVVNGDVVTVTVPEEHVFIMSDNRFEGVDSRHFGAVPISAMESVLRREVNNG
jgi:signal peptidase I